MRAVLGDRVDLLDLGEARPALLASWRFTTCSKHATIFSSLGGERGDRRLHEAVGARLERARRRSSRAAAHLFERRGDGLARRYSAATPKRLRAAAWRTPPSSPAVRDDDGQLEREARRDDLAEDLAERRRAASSPVALRDERLDLRALGQRDAATAQRLPQLADLLRELRAPLERCEELRVEPCRSPDGALPLRGACRSWLLVLAISTVAASPTCVPFATKYEQDAARLRRAPCARERQSPRSIEPRSAAPRWPRSRALSGRASRDRRASRSTEIAARIDALATPRATTRSRVAPWMDAQALVPPPRARRARGEAWLAGRTSTTAIVRSVRDALRTMPRRRRRARVGERSRARSPSRRAGA